MFHHNTHRIAAMMFLLSTAALPSTGHAASYVDALPKAQATSYTASLAQITQGDTSRTTQTLDWRQPTLQLYFDLPPAERTSEIVLTLSADPLTRVAADAPLQVQFNNSKPVPVYSNGQGFEARIPFDAAVSRKRGNSLRIIYPNPKGSDCVTPAHGEWSVDLANSTLRMAGRANNRNMSLADVEARLRQPALSPKKVGLIARGTNGTDMQALAAQAIALRTPGVPKFSVTAQGNDFNVVMVTRDRLFDITNDPMILNSHGPRIFVPKGRPTQIIFTADTDAEILLMLESFSTHHLPSTPRAISSLGELNLQTRLDQYSINIEGKTRLSDLGGRISGPGFLSDNWASGPQTYRFGVSDPASTKAELLLRLATTDDVADTSRLRVALNGEVLGAAKLDRKRKSVAFDIEAGKLNATSNVLSISPELNAKPGYSCVSLAAGPQSFTIGQGSRLTLKQDTPSPVTELSLMTASGGIFAETESYVILPQGTRDYQAALGVLGRLAKSTGHGLTLADYTRKEETRSTKHRLIIGPAKLANQYITGAPKALRDALNGQTTAGDNLLQANIERFASTGSDRFAVQYAAAQAQPRKIKRGGVAALYSTGGGKLTGVISAAPGESFIRSSGQLVQPAYWNAVQGGVSRWNTSSVVMAQTAQPVPGFTPPVMKRELNLPDFDFSGIEMPQINWPDFDIPQVTLPKLSLPKFTWPRFGAAEKTADTTNNTVQRAVYKVPDQSTPKSVDFGTPTTAVQDAPILTAPVKTASVMPRLKPTFKKPTQRGGTLRGKFEFETPKPAGNWSFQDVRQNADLKWDGTQRWFKAKTGDLKQIKPLEDIAKMTDRLQDQVRPVGHSLRNSVNQNLPGKRLVQLGDRTVSVYGLMLIIALALVLLLMSVAGPSSRLGGRH